MKNRKRQRANRKMKEELLDLRDSCGLMDPTPYEAVKMIVLELKNNNEGRNKKWITSRC